MQTDFGPGARVAVMGSGSVEYGIADAVRPIQDVIDALEQAKEDGAEWVVASSGNYRGAQWSSVDTNIDEISTVESDGYSGLRMAE